MDSALNAFLAKLDTEQVNENSLTLDQLDGRGIARLMNEADRGVADAVAQATDAIGAAIDEVALRVGKGGRLVYLGAGTSGRLGVLDASECPPTFSVPPTTVQGIMAGGDAALRNAVEGAEDDQQQAALDLERIALGAGDAVVAISASGYAPYCVGALRYAKKVGALAIAMCCNTGARLSAYGDIAIEMPTGPEVLAGSTRLKAGTATKMALNMLSTGVMVRTGRVYGNLMVDLSVSNRKLSGRAVRIVARAAGLPEQEAERLLQQAGGQVKTAIVMALGGMQRQEAEKALRAARGFVRAALEGKAP